MVVNVGSAATAASSSGFQVLRFGSLAVSYSRGWPGAVAAGGGESLDASTPGLGGKGGVQSLARFGYGPKAIPPVTVSKWCAGGDGGTVPAGTTTGSAGGGGAGGYSAYPYDIQPVSSYIPGTTPNITWPNCSGGVGGGPGKNGAGGVGEGAAGGGGGSRGTNPVAGGGGGMGLLGRNNTGAASGSDLNCPLCGQGGSSTTYLGGDDGAVANANNPNCTDNEGRVVPICGGEYGGGAPGGRDGKTRLGGNGACIVLLPSKGTYPTNVKLSDVYGY